MPEVESFKGVIPGFAKSKSEDALPNAIDKSLADALIKTGSSTAVGGLLSIILFKRRMWPVTLGLGIGLGMAISNFEHNMNSSMSPCTRTPTPK